MNRCRLDKTLLIDSLFNSASVLCTIGSELKNLNKTFRIRSSMGCEVNRGDSGIVSGCCGNISERCGNILVGCGSISEDCESVSEGCGSILEDCESISVGCKSILEVSETISRDSNGISELENGIVVTLPKIT